jgi:photosystem II stability/assembly factor-like uncharacterized protein
MRDPTGVDLLATTGDAFVRVGAHTRLQGSGAQCLAVNGDVVYVGCRGSGLKRSADRGDTFEEVPLPERDVFSVAVSGADGAVYAGTEPSRLFRSGDRGESWEELDALRGIPSKPEWRFPPRPWTSHVRWIAPSPHDPALVLVGIELGGLMRTDDGGSSFSDHRPPAARDVHCLAWHPSAAGRAYETGGDGVAWSRDGGRSWERADAGRDRRYAWALAVDPDDPDRWFLSAAPGPYEAHGGGPSDSAIYRWSGDGPWQAVAGPFDSHVYALATGPGRIVAGLGDGTLLLSEDGGESWGELGERTGGITALALMSGPRVPAGPG